jgi:hypothetical protein
MPLAISAHRSTLPLSRQEPRVAMSRIHLLNGFIALCVAYGSNIGDPYPLAFNSAKAQTMNAPIPASV